MTIEFEVEELVPHSGRMCLLDRVVEYGEDWLHAEVSITADSLFVDEKGVPAWIGLEYLAQTIGAYAGLQERLMGEQPKLGFLVSTRRYTCSDDYFSIGQILLSKVQREIESDSGLNVFQCKLEGQGLEAMATLNVYQPKDVDQFLQDSKHE